MWSSKGKPAAASVPPQRNPPPSVPGRLASTPALFSSPSFKQDSEEYYTAVVEVRMTERAIEKEMEEGRTLEHYTLKPDKANSVTYEMFLGGQHERTIFCRKEPVQGMAFASLQKRGTCAHGICELDVAPCCGMCRCFLFRRYKLGIRTNGDVDIVNDFPVRPLSKGCGNGRNWAMGCCSVFAALTCGEFESKKKYQGTICVSETKDGARITRMEQGIRHQRGACHAALIGAQRRGTLEDTITTVLSEEYPFFKNWSKPKDRPENNLDSSPEKEAPPATVAPVALKPEKSPESDTEMEAPPLAFAPVAVAVPMEPMER